MGIEPSSSFSGSISPRTDPAARIGDQSVGTSPSGGVLRISEKQGGRSGMSGHSDEMNLKVLCPTACVSLIAGTTRTQDGLGSMSSPWEFCQMNRHVQRDNGSDGSDGHPRWAGDRYEVDIAARGLAGTRAFVREIARRMSLDEERTADLTLVINELATNAVVHGGGGGRLALWNEDGRVVGELVGGAPFQLSVPRVEPAVQQESGLGLWLVERLAQRMSIRERSGQSVVRIEI